MIAVNAFISIFHTICHFLGFLNNLGHGSKIIKIKENRFNFIFLTDIVVFCLKPSDRFDCTAQRNVSFAR